MLVLGRKNIPARNFDANRIKEPFLLMSYDIRRGLGGTIYTSSDIQEVRPAELQVMRKSRKESEITRYERLLGYGNHYFRIPHTGIARECCDNKRDDDMSHNEYLERKRLAYHGTLSVLASDTEEESPSAAIVSNCGNFLTIESKDRRLGFNRRDIIRQISLIGKEEK
jgi:hypothetical protein